MGLVLDHRGAAEFVRPSRAGVHQKRAGRPSPADLTAARYGKDPLDLGIAKHHFKSRARSTPTFQRVSAGGLEHRLDELGRAPKRPTPEGEQHHHLSGTRMVEVGRISRSRCWPAPPMHHHLLRTGLRTSVGLVVERGEPRRCITALAPGPVGRKRQPCTGVRPHHSRLKDRLTTALDDYESSRLPHVDRQGLLR